MQLVNIKYLFLLLITFSMFLLVSFSEDKNVSEKTPLTQRFDPEIQDFAFILPNLEPVEGIPGIKAKDCAVCHQTIYNEWQKSTHASALRDIQFQSEITKPDSPKWLCLNCHIPLQNQREYIVTHLLENDVFKPITKPNHQFDPELQQEAVTCATCHVRQDDDSGKSYIIGPNGSELAPHPVRQDRRFLRNMCQRCHNPQGEALTPNLVCWFESTKELAEALSQITATFGKPKDCVDCHMPEQQRLVADIFPDLPQREVNQHSWVGSGIPKWYDGYDHLLERGYESGLEITVGNIDTAFSDNEMTVTIRFKNVRAGHYITTGDPERFILAMAALQDVSGKELFRDKLRIGQTWEWNPARKIDDNRLKQGEQREWEVKFTLPKNSDNLRFVVTAYHVRLNSETAKYIIAAEGVDGALFENGQHFVSNAIDYYPFASYIFKEEIEIKSGNRREYSPRELIQLSKAEQGKALSERVY